MFSACDLSFTTCLRSSSEAPVKVGIGRVRSVTQRSSSWKCVASERIHELTEQSFGHTPLVGAEALRLTIDRHVEGAERHVDERKQPREVLVEPLLLRCVMPAMKGWARDRVAQR